MTQRIKKKIIFNYIKDNYTYGSKNQSLGWIYHPNIICETFNITNEELLNFLKEYEENNLLRREVLAHVFSVNGETINEPLYTFFAI